MEKIPRITLEIALQHLEAQGAAFLDVRTPEEISVGKILGAKEVLLSELDEEALQDVGLGDKGAKMIVNCRSGGRGWRPGLRAGGTGQLTRPPWGGLPSLGKRGLLGGREGCLSLLGRETFFGRGWEGYTLRRWVRLVSLGKRGGKDAGFFFISVIYFAGLHSLKEEK